MAIGLYIAFCTGYALAVWLYVLNDLPAPWPVAIGAAVVTGALIAYGTMLFEALTRPSDPWAETKPACQDDVQAK